MMKACLISLMALGALVAGCGDDSGSGGAGGSGSTTTSGTTSSTKSSSGSGTTTTSTTTGTTTSGTTTAATTTGSTTASTGTGGMLDCTADPQGDPCIECAKANCCDEAQTCAGDAECGVCLACVEMTGDPLSCIGMCDLQDPETGAVLQCVQGSCAMDCGLGG